MSNLKKLSKGEYAFEGTNIFVLILFCLTTLYPFIYLLSLSFTSADASMVNIRLIPEKLSIMNYQKVFASPYILTGFQSTITRTVLAIVTVIPATVCMAYPLSKKNFPDKNLWTGIIVFTMFFGGGLIPNYLLVKDLGLINSVWSLILPGLIPTFSMIIVRNFFMAIPDSLEESAKIDGANDIYILLMIVIPLSKPILATLLLWVTVDHWNSWFDSMLYITETKKQVLQIVLRRIVLEGTQQLLEMNTGAHDTESVSPESVKAATIMVTTLPIIMTYPFLQKYFVKGILVGSLKG